MAYIVAHATTLQSTVSASIVAKLPAHIISGDLLLACVTQDGDTTAIAMAGWTEISTQAANLGVRQAWFRKTAGGSESDPTITGSTQEWVITILAVRDADATTPIDASGVASWSGATAAAPSVTTTTDDCLILRAYAQDDGAIRHVIDDEAVNLVKESITAINHSIHYHVKGAAGATGTMTAYCESAARGGRTYTIAIRNASGGKAEPWAKRGPKRVRWYGNLSATNESVSWSALSPLAATIDGLAVSATATTQSIGLQAQNPIDMPWGLGTLLTSTLSTAGAWVGAVHNITAADFTGKLFSVLWFCASRNDTTFGAKGFVVVFGDASGNWQAFQMGPYDALFPAAGDGQMATVACGAATPYDSSGTLNWAAITKIGYGYHRAGASVASAGFLIKQGNLQDPVILVGGSAAKPATFALTYQAGVGNGAYDTANLQGARQVLSRAGIQIGDGSIATYFDAAQSAHEFETPRNVAARTFGWQVTDNKVGWTIYASANDTIKFRSTVTSTPSKQNFTIHASSSTLATYDFAGANIIGYEVTWRDGITCNDAAFVNCYTITANGGTFDGCVIQGSVAGVALTTSDPAQVLHCEFISGGTGHGLEITAPGTYTFTANHFTGYGSAGTTDAAVYNNSGGAVTLNITGGGSTPTVRNGAGATTTINNNATLTIENLIVGSSVRVERVSDGSLVEFRTAASTTEVFSVASAVNYRIKVRKASAAPKYDPWQTITGTLAGDSLVFAAQVPDLIA